MNTQNNHEEISKSDQQRAERDKRLDSMKNADGSKKKIRTGPKPWKIALIIVIIAAVVLGLVWLVLRNNGYREINTPAGSIDGKNISALEANFYAGMQFQNMIPAGAFTENGKSILAQSYPMADGEVMSVRDSILTNFRQQIVEVKFLSEEAHKNNFELSDEDKALIDDFAKQVQEGAAASQMTPDDLLRSLCGPGASLNTIRPILEEQLLSDRYRMAKLDEMEVSDEEMETYYESNKDDLDKVDLRVFTINAASPEPEKKDEAKASEESAESEKDVDASEEDDKNAADEADKDDENQDGEQDSDKASDKDSDEKTENADKKLEDADKQERLIQEARDKAQKMLDGVKDEKSFRELATQYAANESERENIEKNDSTMVSGAQKNLLQPDMAAWAFDSERKEGDKTVIDGPGGSSIVYFIRRYRDERPIYNSRHILIKLADDLTDEALDKAKEDAKAEAERILELYRSGEQTEEAFGELAKEYSQDPGSKDRGGLYENIMPGSFVKPYEDWMAEEGRKAGDVGIVYAESGNYKGYHIIYFVGAGDPAWKVNVSATLRAQALRAWINDNTATLYFKDNPEGMKLVIPADPDAAASVQESLNKVKETEEGGEDAGDQPHDTEPEASQEAEKPSDETAAEESK